MTDKAYIVANEQQEREVLEVLCINGMKCFSGAYSQFRPLTGFPYVIYEPDNSNVLKPGRVPKIKYSTEILYDGRKEENMSDKYVVSQEFMNDLKDWKDTLTKHIKPGYFIDFDDLSGLSETVYMWWGDEVSDEESNNRLIAIIRWVNGEDVFEVEKPKKWAVRSKGTDNDNGHWYVYLPNNIDEINNVVYYMSSATLFDTKEEAESWANSHQEVIQVESE